MDRDQARAIEWDCAQVVQKFYHCLDHKKYDEMADLFAEDGTWVRLGKPLQGRENIRKAMRERESWLTAHLVSNLHVTVIDADHAETMQYITLYRHEGVDTGGGKVAAQPVVLPLAVLRHRDRLVRERGTWKIHNKSSQQIMMRPH
jgi:uncharacterized protein (TIGR02246 family)